MHDFEKVRGGEPLVAIVDDDYRAHVKQERANVVAAEAAIQSLDQQKLVRATIVTQVRADIRASEADVTWLHLETACQQTLLGTGIVGTRQIVELAIDNDKRADATLPSNRAKLEQLQQQLNVLDKQRA